MHFASGVQGSRARRRFCCLLMSCCFAKAARYYPILTGAAGLTRDPSQPVRAHPCSHRRPGIPVALACFTCNTGNLEICKNLGGPQARDLCEVVYADGGCCGCTVPLLPTSVLQRAKSAQSTKTTRRQRAFTPLTTGCFRLTTPCKSYIHRVSQVRGRILD